MPAIRFIWNIIYDHWKMAISGSGIVVLGILYHMRDLVLHYLTLLVPVWTFFLIAILLLMVVSLYNFYFSDAEVVKADDSTKPTNVIIEYESTDYVGVTWKPWMGSGSEFSDRRIWADGPYCPKCMYELDRFEKSWLCVGCNKKYTIPAHLRINTLFKIIKVFTVKSAKGDGLKSKEITTV
jgi:large-conductance mechanosensitive channel